MITATFHCGGCDAKAEGTRPLDREFVSITGRSYGFGSYRYTQTIDVCPDGWVAYDIIGCCYCPTCWESIQPETEEEPQP